MEKKKHSFKEIFTQLGVNVDSSKTYDICPFCLRAGNVKNNEKTFGADENDGIFNCFKCHVSGKPFSFVMQYNGLDADATKSWFRDAFGSSNYTPPPQTKSPAIATPTAQDGKQYTAQYRKLIDKLPTVGRLNYLVTERGLNLDVLRQNEVRDATTEGKFKLLNYFSQEEALNAGISTISKAGNLFYLFSYCKYVMPLYDGEIIECIQGKSDNYWFLRNIKSPTFSIPKQPESDFYYICEGILTALAFLSDGKPAMCITSKGYKIDEVLRKLEPYKNKHFILSPDIDKPKFDKNGKKIGKTGVDVMMELQTQLIKNCYNIEKDLHSVRLDAKAQKLWDIEFNKKYGYKDYGDILKYKAWRKKRDDKN